MAVSFSCRLPCLLGSRLLWRQRAMTFQSRNAMSGLIHKDTHSASEPPSDPDQPVQMENPYHETPPRCPLCHFRVDFKNTQLLSQFVSPFTGRILSAEVTGLCKKKQKEVSKAIKRAQNAAFLPVIHKDPTFIHDPRILADKQTQ